jgi:molybdopterin converting factor small subunit
MGVMKVAVEFFSLVEEITKVRKKEVILKKKQPQVMDLLQVLFEDFGPAFENAVFDGSSNDLKPGILVAVNGKNAYLLQGAGTALNEGDRIVIGFAFRGG